MGLKPPTNHQLGMFVEVSKVFLTPAIHGVT